jgi:SAM-dependent methyltransferase
MTGVNRLQLDWNVVELHGAWPHGPDNNYLLGRLRHLPAEVTAQGARGPILEVAASHALHSALLSRMGFRTVALDPSAPMLAEARATMAEWDTRFDLVRGIAERLPFPDATFDRVLCESGIDHLAEPAVGIREMTRVLRPDGRLVIGVVNYGSVNVRVSRLLYRLGRRMGRVPPGRHLFWDSPVPHEHTFEATWSVLVGLCGQYLELDHARGVSIGWAFPGWGTLLARLPARQARRVLRTLDRVAKRVPRIADYVLTVWKPRTWDADVY